MLLAYEVTRDLPLEMIEVETPLAKTMQPTIAGKKLVFAPILRAGVGFLDGMLNLVPSARVAHIGLYRDPQTLEAVEYYFKAPVDVAERLVIVMDPMLATANSAVAAIDRLKRRGVKDIRFVCLLAAPEGIERLTKAHPDVEVWTAAIDEKLNDHGYIVPGPRRRRATACSEPSNTAGDERRHSDAPTWRPSSTPSSGSNPRSQRVGFCAPEAVVRRVSGPFRERPATGLLATAALLAEPHLLRQSRTRLSVSRRDHRIIRRKAPLLPIFFGRQVILGPQMPLQ